VMHFDPREVPKAAAPDSNSPLPAPFFINGQFLSEGVEFEGKGLQKRMSVPKLATADARLTGLGPRSPITGGNCGGCADGCSKVPTDVSAAVVEQQQFQLQHVDPVWKQSIAGRIYYFARRVYVKFVPSWLSR